MPISLICVVAYILASMLQFTQIAGIRKGDFMKRKTKGTKNREKSVPSGHLSKVNFIILAVLALLIAAGYYLVTPSINVQSREMWIILLGIAVLALFATLDMKAKTTNARNTETKVTKPIGISVLIVSVIIIVGAISSSKMFGAANYAGLINIEDGSFETDIKESTRIDDIALMDTDTARIIGERAIGSLSDVVSQYEVSDDYSTIDLNGQPMKVAALEYAGFIKYMNNRKSGIPGYVLVDPVGNEAQYVKLDKPMIYSPSAYLGHNLYRHVQMAYPTYMFEGMYLELDDDGNPYYVCPVLKSNSGLFGAKDVKGIVLCDPCTGDMQYMAVGSIPNWVDRVYDGDLACQKYDWYGKLSGGFWNSVFGNKGCKVTTDDYGYKVMDGDVWVYTGVTSVNGDESNIGFVMINLRTGQSKYYSIAGAEEHSAMKSAEGAVQHLGYDASFPSLINISGIPTYIMVLKDDGGLVKMYALVDVEKYNIVATGATQTEALASYRKLLAQNGITAAKGTDDGIPSREIVVADIKYINMDDSTFVYITDSDGGVYKQDFSENESLIFIQTGDKIKVFYEESENGINELISYE